MPRGYGTSSARLRAKVWNSQPGRHTGLFVNLRSIELIDRTTPAKHASLADKWKTNCVLYRTGEKLFDSNSATTHRFCGRPSHCVHATRLNGVHTRMYLQQTDRWKRLNEIACESRDRVARANCWWCLPATFRFFLRDFLFTALCIERGRETYELEGDRYANEANGRMNVLRGIDCLERRNEIGEKPRYLEHKGECRSDL